MENLYKYNNSNLLKSSSKFSKREDYGSIEKFEMENSLKEWAAGLLSISNAFANNDDYKSIAKNVILKNYAYDLGVVLFKPTLASSIPFRNSYESTLSYFIGGDKNYPEDRGFALNPWSKVEFDIAGFIASEKQGLVMGNKILKQHHGNTTIANFTMGFIRSLKGDLKINLHHSSLPYSQT